MEIIKLEVILRNIFFLNNYIDHTFLLISVSATDRNYTLFFTLIYILLNNRFISVSETMQCRQSHPKFETYKEVAFKRLKTDSETT